MTYDHYDYDDLYSCLADSHLAVPLDRQQGRHCGPQAVAGGYHGVVRVECEGVHHQRPQLSRELRRGLVEALAAAPSYA
eukprot:8063885-Pyramimonas_sp.AAC.2